MSDRLEVIDAQTLPAHTRALLQPDRVAPVSTKAEARLPRYFYKVQSWKQAWDTKLSAHFTLAELMLVDCREAAPLLRRFPHYVPCSLSVLARYLETFRERCEAPVFVSVNGGYRSPAHHFSGIPSLHAWGSAVDIYRIGDTWLDDEKTIENLARFDHTDLSC